MDTTAQPNTQAADDLAQLTKNPTPTLADDVEEFEEKQNDFQSSYNAGGHFKEQLESIAQSWDLKDEVQSSPEILESVQEIPTEPEIESEMEGYLEKIEKETQLQQGTTDGYTNVLMTPAPQNPQVQLLLTPSQIKWGMQRQVWEAVRWLAVWCLRQMKMVSLKRA